MPHAFYFFNTISFRKQAVDVKTAAGQCNGLCVIYQKEKSDRNLLETSVVIVYRCPFSPCSVDEVEDEFSSYARKCHGLVDGGKNAMI